MKEVTGAFPGKKVLSPNKTDIIQDQPSSNVQKHSSRIVVKNERAILEMFRSHKNCLKSGQSHQQKPGKKF